MHKQDQLNYWYYKSVQNMINYDAAKENIKYHSPNWPQINDHPERILIFRGSGSEKKSQLLNLIKQQDDDNYSVI